MRESGIELDRFGDGITAKAIDPHRIALLHERGKLLEQPRVAALVDTQLKDRIIHPHTVLAEQFVDLFAALVADDVVGDEDVHSNSF